MDRVPRHNHCTGLPCSQCRQGGCLQFHTRIFLLLLFSCPKHQHSRSRPCVPPETSERAAPAVPELFSLPLRFPHLCFFCWNLCFFYLAPPEALHEFFGWCFWALVLQTCRTWGISCSRLQTWEHTSYVHFQWWFTNPPAFFQVLCCCFSSPLIQHF